MWISGTPGDTVAHGISRHTEFNTWKVFYTDASGDEQEAALGADGTVMTGTGTSGAPAFQAATEHESGHTDAVADGSTKGLASFVAADASDRFPRLDVRQAVHHLDRPTLLVQRLEQHGLPGRDAEVGRAVLLDRHRAQHATGALRIAVADPRFIGNRRGLWQQ
ncbi:hypothetical protein LCGC14_2961890, partial [marine sediment metagenome]